MKYNTHFLTPLLVVGFLAGCAHNRPVTSQERPNSAAAQPTPTKAEEARFYQLGRLAKESVDQGKMDEARGYASELLELLPKFPKNWNYGNAVQDGNLVLGRIAVQEERLEDAKRYLLEAGNSPGSPQMNSFGPNMSLAKDLLEKGEREVVLKYFESCRKFWRLENGRLNQWSLEARTGKIPDFGANLLY